MVKLAKFKLFYGWYIVAAIMLVTAFYGAFFAYGFTAFVNPIVVAHGLINICSKNQIDCLHVEWFHKGVNKPQQSIGASLFHPKRCSLYRFMVILPIKKSYF